jgi:excinuclease UvrABC nuclease subunit
VDFLNEQLGLRQCSGRLKPGQRACILLDMGKCLGPCVGAVSAETYGAAVEEAVGTLRGESTGVLDRAAQHRDELAEQLRFEQAAELRDRIRQLEHVIGVQQRLTAFADRHVVVVTPDRQPDRVRLLLVRAGRLADEVSVPVDATRSHLRQIVRRVFSHGGAGPVGRDELDDLLILDAWLRKHRDEVVEVPVHPNALDNTAAALHGVLAARRPVPATA